MSIEQTDQLIRLVLNSLLLVITCVAVTNGLLMRQTAFIHRLRTTHKEYLELLEGSTLLKNDRLLQLKGQLRQLRHHYRVVHVSLLTAHYALLLCMASTVAVAFRMLFSANWLIYIALVLFVMGTIVLLFSIGLTLLDVYATSHSLREEISWILSLGVMEPSLKRGKPKTRRLGLQSQATRQLNRTAN